MRRIARRCKQAPNSSSLIEIAVPKAPLLYGLQNNRVMAVTVHPDLAAFDRLKTRIQGLRSKTTDNGCTEAEALLAAAKVAELLDRYDLSLTDVEIRDAPCEQREYETYRKKRIPLDDCVGAIANFCDCRVWREKNQAGEGPLCILRSAFRYRSRALPDRADR